MSGGRRSALPGALLALLLAAGCGGGGGGDAGDVTLPGTVAVDPAEDVGTAPRSFQSKDFEPPVTFRLPAGWRIEESFGVIQAFRGSGDRWALTFASAADGGPVGSKVEEIRGTPDIAFEEPEPVTIDGYEGQMFAAESNASVPVEGTEYFALRHSVLRIWVVDVEGTLVMVFAEAGALRKDERDPETDTAFFNEVEQMLASADFAPTP